MATAITVLRTCGLSFLFILYLCSAELSSSKPWIESMTIVSKSCLNTNCKYLLNVRGGAFLGHYSWRLTPEEASKGAECDIIYPEYELREIETTQWNSMLELSLPVSDKKVFFCLHHSDEKNSPFGGKWVHQGGNLFLHPKNSSVSAHDDWSNQTTKKTNTPEMKRSGLQNENSEWADLSHDIDVNFLTNGPRKTRDQAALNLNTNELDEDNNFVINTNQEEVDGVRRFKLNDEFKNRIDFNDNYNTMRRAKRDIIKSDKNKHNFQNSDFAVNRIVPGNDFWNLREERQADDFSDFTGVRGERVPIQIEGLRVEESGKEPKIIDNSIISVLADTKVTLRLFGQGITPRTAITFTDDPHPYGQPCRFNFKGEYLPKKDSVTPASALYDIVASPSMSGLKLFICAKNVKLEVDDPSEDDEKYIHQGSESWKILAVHSKLLPLYVTLILILICLMFSALFSGLNLGLMSLDRTELKIISNTGTEQERKYARAIMPVRDHGNYLLCSILLGNVAVNSTFTILLDELTSGLFAVIFSTLAIVLLGEITPQAICSRHGLMVGARSICVTKAVMALTAPLAYPVSKLLDYFLGEEIGSVYNRERLKELVKVTTDMNDLDRDEVNIIAGALELRKKTVTSVMTKLEDVFMLPITSILDFETMSEIVKSGFSRIPVYEVSRSNIVTVLFIKDLAFVDPDDNTPLQTLCQYYQNPCNFVFEDVTLDIMFKMFKEGQKGHMAFVHRINNEGEGDPFYETIGLVTLEDVIEEMIQAEIVDETDVFLDNKSKRRRNRPQHRLADFAAFAERHENQRIHISPQLTLATFQFLSTSVDAFKPDSVSETVLKRLLRQDVIHYIKLKGKSKTDPAIYVFQQGKPVDYFVLILEGRVEVTVGRENLVFEAGPFTYFGSQALTQNVGVAESPTPSAMGSLQNINMESMLRTTFVPDYSVRATTELYYLTVKRSLYLAAKRATLMEKGVLSKGPINEQFDTEVDKHFDTPSSANSKKLLSTVSRSDLIESADLENNYKLLQSVDEDMSMSGDHKTPSRQVSPNPQPVSASPHTRASFNSGPPGSPGPSASIGPFSPSTTQCPAYFYTQGTNLPITTSPNVTVTSANVTMTSNLSASSNVSALSNVSATSNVSAMSPNVYVSSPNAGANATASLYSTSPPTSYATARNGDLYNSSHADEQEKLLKE